ncbi:hypothetical protein WMO79_01040 [Micrococcaceae bacterium Sec7.4]
MPEKSLDQLQPGDKVTLKRNLDHPAWMKQGPYDEYEGGRRLVRNPDIAEDLGTATVTERRDIAGTNTGWMDRKPKNLVRLGSNGFWYDLADGMQDGSHATLIEAIHTDSPTPET